jgi:hypothetical protein
VTVIWCGSKPNVPGTGLPVSKCTSLNVFSLILAGDTALEKLALTLVSPLTLVAPLGGVTEVTVSGMVPSPPALAATSLPALTPKMYPLSQ